MLWGLTATKLGVAHTFFAGIGSVQKLVDGSLYPVNIMFPLKMTSHFLLSKRTLHALHRGRMPMRDAIDSDEMMCPINTVRRPGMIMLHTCVDWICFPSGNLICTGELVMHLLSTSVPSMMKMEVAPVSVIA